MPAIPATAVTPSAREEEWERVSQRDSSGLEEHPGGCERSDSDAGNDDWALVGSDTVGFQDTGPLGDGTGGLWDRCDDYEVSMARAEEGAPHPHRRRTKAASPVQTSSSFAEVVCAGPFGKAARRSGRGRNSSGSRSLQAKPRVAA